MTQLVNWIEEWSKSSSFWPVVLILGVTVGMTCQVFLEHVVR